MSALLALLASVASVAPPAAVAMPETPGLLEALAACSSEKWDDAAFAGQGFLHGAHFSLVAKGQRVQEYYRKDERPDISLYSSFMEYVACSTGIDLEGPQAFIPARDAVVSKLGLASVQLKDQPLSPNAKAFIKEYDLEGVDDAFSNGRQIVSFKFRQFSGKNRMAVYVIRLH